MANKKLKRLQLDTKISERLQKQNFIVCQDVLLRSKLELIKALGLSEGVIRKLTKSVSKSVCPRKISAIDLWDRNQEGTGFLATSLHALDNVLHGGIPSGTITEIAGPPGCGKTQSCIMLSVLATLSKTQGGLEGSVLYIDTESAFNPIRLVEVATSRLPELFKSKDDTDALSSIIHVCTESTCASLLKRLETIEEGIIENNIRMVVLDSVASLVRKEFDPRSSRNLIDRTNLLAKQASILKYVAESFNIPVIVTNQITTRYGKDVVVDDGDQAADEGKVTTQTEGYVTAALGNTWSHCVNTRLIVQYLDGPYRQILVAKSPIAPFAKFVYRIRKEGIVLEEDGAEHYEGTDPGLQKIRTRAPLPISAFNQSQL